MRVVHTMKWGDILEPLTWVNAPIGSFTIIMPEPPVKGAFRQMTIQYEKPIISAVQADCSQSTIHSARPDKDGTFRYTTPDSVEMSGLQKRWYCEYDWTREKEAFRTEYLRQASDQSKTR